MSKEQDIVERYRVVQMQFDYWVKDDKEKKWLANCMSKSNAEHIVIILNEHEKWYQQNQKRQ